MRWEIIERDGRYCVVKTGSGQVENCHDSRADADQHLRALNATDGEQPAMATIDPPAPPAWGYTTTTGTMPLYTTTTNTTSGGLTINVNPPLAPAPAQAASDPAKPDGDPATSSGGSQAPAAILCEVAGRLLLTSRAEVVRGADQLPREMAAAYEQATSRNPHWLWLQGRFVEADQPNANGAYWSTQDLEFGELSVAHAPLNFLHQADRIIGAITQARLYYPQQASDRAHIAAQSVVWRPYHPHEASLIEAAAEQGQLWYSMECVGESVTCESASDGTRQGCGATFQFAQVYSQPEGLCEHVRERSSQLHINNPTFIGGAVIIPPAMPAWRNADLEVAGTVADLAERTWREAAQTRLVTSGEWERLMGELLAFARGS